MTSETNEDRDAPNDSTGTQLDLSAAVADAAANRPTVATYARGPDTNTVTDSIEELLTHAREQLRYELTDERVEKLATAAPEHAANGAGDPPTTEQDGAAVTFDINDEHPAGIEFLLDVVTEHDVDNVIAESLAEFGAVDAATRTVERLQDEGTTVHLIEDDLTVAPNDDQTRAAFAAARRTAGNDAGGNELVTEGSTDGWTGRPPLGFTVGPTGQLRRTDRWDEIRNVVKTHDDGLITAYRASQLLDCSRDAVRNAKRKYRDLYRLDAPDIDASADAAEQ